MCPGGASTHRWVLHELREALARYEPTLVVLEMELTLPGIEIVS